MRGVHISLIAFMSITEVNCHVIHGSVNEVVFYAFVYNILLPHLMPF